MKLNEYKNISNEVYEFSAYLYKKIIEECQRLPKQKSNKNSAIFVEGVLDLTSNDTKQWIFNALQSLNVTFIMYYANTTHDYNTTMQIVGGDANSESDYERGTLKLVSGFIGGEPSPDFMGAITHEVNHLFEYDNGREKCVPLYDKVVEMMNKRNEDENAFAVGYALYFTFPHERDAFVHQFYGFLKQENPSWMGFEELLSYSAYQILLGVYNNLHSNRNDENIMRWINYVGYDRNGYFKRIKNGLKKMKAKMYNAYVRYMSENNSLTEGRINRIVLEEIQRYQDCEQYNEEIKWGIEGLYKF